MFVNANMTGEVLF